jgi:hypothetical protein
MNDEKVFKECPMCRKIWKSREEFLDDNCLQLEGYSADFEVQEKGLFYFTHRMRGCFSTMALEAKAFFDLYTGKRYPDSKMDSDECSRFCLDRRNLDRCPALCEFAFVREIIQIIKGHHGDGIKSVSDPVVNDARRINE